MSGLMDSHSVDDDGETCCRCAVPPPLWSQHHRTEGRHPAVREALLQLAPLDAGASISDVTTAFSQLAFFIVGELPDDPGLTRCLRLLWESRRMALRQISAYADGEMPASGAAVSD